MGLLGVGLRQMLACWMHGEVEQMDAESRFVASLGMTRSGGEVQERERDNYGYSY